MNALEHTVPWNATIEIRVKGKLVKVPVLEIGGNTIFVKGKWLRVAAIRSEIWLEKELEDPEACIQKLKESSGPRADIFTFAQRPPATVPRYTYPMEPDSLAVADTSNFKRWWESLPQETRKNVRRAEKRGVVVSVREFSDDLVRGIMDVSNDSPVRQGGRNLYYGMTFERAQKDHSPFLDRSQFICAHVGEELIGFLKLVHRGDVASVMNLATKASHNDKRPANALLAKAVELCEAKGGAHLTYGMFNYGNKRDSPLREFKIRNGFEEVLVPRFYVPLTMKGALCVKLNLHRGLLGILPNSVITALVSLRARLYTLKK